MDSNLNLIRLYLKKLYRKFWNNKNKKKGFAKMKFYYHNFKDLRGNHIKYFANGDDFKVEEVFTTISHKNVLRGFHTSSKQEKLIKVLNGSLHLITVNEDTKEITHYDMNVDSEPIFIPLNTWVGYVIKEDNYICSGKFSPETDLTCSPKSFSNEWLWPIPYSDIIISEKDDNAEIKNL